MNKLIWWTLLFCLPAVWGYGQAYNSLYADTRGHQVGDILSVMIVESANASRETKSNKVSKSDWKARGGVSGDVTSLTPTLGINSSWENGFDGKEGTEQRDQLTGRIAVRIIKKTKNGMFKIKGRRKLGVNASGNVLRLIGYIRPQDINADNTVYSYDIADARIIYQKSEILNSIIKQGGFAKLFSKLVGVAVLAVAAGFFSLTK